MRRAPRLGVVCALPFALAALEAATIADARADDATAGDAASDAAADAIDAPADLAADAVEDAAPTPPSTSVDSGRLPDAELIAEGSGCACETPRARERSGALGLLPAVALGAALMRRRRRR